MPSLETLYKFEADADRAKFLNERMRLRLADSLAYVFEEAHTHLSVTRPRFEEFLQRLRARPVSPLAFSFYCDLVLAIEQDEMDEASELVETLVTLPEHPGNALIAELRDPETDPASARIARFVQADPETPFDIFAPPAEAAAACRKQVSDALAFIDSGDSALGAEIRALIQEITLAYGKKGAGVATFDGASSFMLWGGIIVNADRNDGPFEMVQMLAHESAHNLLFAFCVDEPVLENGFEGRYSSPLRTDLRPLEGIYHANFVLARMYRVLKNLTDSGVFTGEDKEKAVKGMARMQALFKSGMDTVREHGKLTPTGQAIIDGAAAYMESMGG